MDLCGQSRWPGRKRHGQACWQTQDSLKNGRQLLNRHDIFSVLRGSFFHIDNPQAANGQNDHHLCSDWLGCRW